jgi:hypothetical protein
MVVLWCRRTIAPKGKCEKIVAVPMMFLARCLKTRMGRAKASNFPERQSGSEMIRVVCRSLEFSGEADGSGVVGTKEI